MLSAISIGAGAILCLGCANTARCFLRKYEEGDYKRALVLKGAAGLCFLALGMLNAAHAVDPDYAWRVCLALALGLAGDELLAARFLYPDRHDDFFSAGAASFAVGHLLYIWALMRLSGAKPLGALPIFMIGYAAALIYGRYRCVNAGKLTWRAAVYIALVVFMAAVACTAAARSFSVGTLMFAAAGICFCVSDCILCAYCYGNRKTAGMNAAVHVTYYTAQLLIAWSIAFI